MLLFRTGTRVLAAATMVALLPSAFAQRPQRLNPPVLPRTDRSSRPVAPGAAGFASLQGASPAASINSTTWTPIGPASLQSGGGLVGGRVTGIAVDPTNNSNIYLATAGGGVWNTTNGGTSWTPLTDGQATLAIGSIAIAPTNHLKIYAGTGEANNSEDSNHGQGILVSSDGGSTWTLETASGAFAGVVIGQIAVDPTNANVAYAAVGGYGENGNFFVNTGIWKTTDGGSTWTNMTAAVGVGTGSIWSAVAIDPTTPTIVYAAIGDFYNGTGNNGLYRSVDSGATWSALANGPNPTSLPTIGRIALAVSPAAKTAGKHVLYVAVAGDPYTTSGGLVYFGRSDNSDAATPTFTNLTSGTPDFLGGENGSGQGWYDIAVGVDANGNVYCSGVEDYNAGGIHAIITSSNLGVTWADISIVNNFEPHTDNHAIAFDSSNNMLAGNDGGIFRYSPSAPGWTDLNSNLNTIQFTAIGLHPTDLGTVVGGSQDNGTELYSNSLVWTERAGGDGGVAKISQTNPMHCYHEYTGASIERSDDGCSTFTVGISAGLHSNTSNFYAPYSLDPTNGDHILFGTDYVNESTNAGSSWSPIGTPGLNGFNPGDSAVDSVAISPANGTNPQVIYASVGGSFALSSRIFVTLNDGATWTERDLPACTVNSNQSIGCRVNQIVVDPGDLTGQTAVAVTNNLTGGGRHVYRTSNAGASWSDITANLPDSPTWSVQIDTDSNHTAYISNELGVYSSSSPYSTWTVYGSGLPHAQGVDLELNSALHLLAVGTHGRGAWEILTGQNEPAAMTSPTPGSRLAGPKVTFSWSAGSGATSYSLRLGTSVGGNNLYGSGPITATSVTPANLPTNGETIYARLTTFFGSTQQYTDYTFTSATQAALTSPANGSILAGKRATFSWSAGVGATSYNLRVGTSVGANNLFGSGPTGVTSVTITNLPTNGENIYARLATNFGSSQVYTDYVFTAVSQAALSSPANGSVLPGPKVTFSWSSGGGATSYNLRIGTSVGSNNVFGSGPITATSITPTNLPTNGATLYARLCTIFSVGQACSDYSFTAATRAAMTSPSPGAVLSGAKVTFTWSAGVGATSYTLRIGTSVGANNLYGSGPITTTSATATNLPTNGSTVYVRLATNFGTSQVYTDYVYTAAP